MSRPEDNKLYNRLGLFRKMFFQLSIEEEQFKLWFKENVGTRTNLWGLSNHNKKFHGLRTGSRFTMHKPSGMKSLNNFSIAHGKYKKDNEGLQVDIIAFIPIHIFLFFYSTVLLISLIFVFSSLGQPIPWPIFVGFFSFIVFFLFWVYWNLKKSINGLVRALEKEFSKV